MMLEVHDIHTSYGVAHILFGVSLEVKEGQAVCLLGRNGMGKTTTLITIMGLIHPTQGSITFQGEDITKEPTHKIASRGIGYVPEERRLFPELTVKENLDIAAIGSKDSDKESALNYFPTLKKLLDRMAGTLSGGEQQMLAIARALIGKPALLLLDEPSEGLAPLIVDDLGRTIKQIRKETTVLLIEQNLQLSLDLADRTYIMMNGAIVFEGTPEELEGSEAIEKYLLV
jgi:branched-chain amino acid transport system ATP-binding protein